MQVVQFFFFKDRFEASVYYYNNYHYVHTCEVRVCYLSAGCRLYKFLKNKIFCFRFSRVVFVLIVGWCRWCARGSPRSKFLATLLVLFGRNSGFCCSSNTLRLRRTVVFVFVCQLLSNVSRWCRWCRWCCHRSVHSTFTFLALFG